jgi:hypothetical protein
MEVCDMIQEAYKKFMHLFNDVSWCGMLFTSSNATQKAKQILKEGLSKNAKDLVEILSSIPIEDLKSFKDYDLLVKHSTELIDRVASLKECDIFIKQTTPEEQSLIQTAYSNIVQIHNIITK